MTDFIAARLFLLIAEESSFTSAARRLGVSATFATRKLAALEDALGRRLFARSTRAVTLTAGGWLFREHAERIVAAVDAALEATQVENAQPSGRLRILCRAGLGRHIVVPHLGEFRALYPNVIIGIEMTEDRVLHVGESGCDVGLTVG